MLGFIVSNIKYLFCVHLFLQVLWANYLDSKTYKNLSVEKIYNCFKVTLMDESGRIQTQFLIFLKLFSATHP